MFVTRNFPLNYLKECTRCYKSIDFADYACDGKYFDAVSTLLKSIGFGVKEISIWNGSIKTGDFVQLLNLIPSVEKIVIYGMKIVNPTEAFLAIAHGFRKLKKLLIYKQYEYGPEINYKWSDHGIEHIFKDVTSLEELDLDTNFGMIAKQPNLKNLYIKGGDFTSLECNENIQVIDFGLSMGSSISEVSMKSLENFVKTQKKIERFHVELYANDVYRCSSILSHILNLETLRSVTSKYALMIRAIPEIRMERFKKLKLRAISSYPRFRPATALELFSDDAHQIFFSESTTP